MSTEDEEASEQTDSIIIKLEPLVRIALVVERLSEQVVRLSDQVARLSEPVAAATQAAEEHHKAGTMARRAAAEAEEARAEYWRELRAVLIDGLRGTGHLGAEYCRDTRVRWIVATAMGIAVLAFAAQWGVDVSELPFPQLQWGEEAR